MKNKTSLTKALKTRVPLAIILITFCLIAVEIIIQPAPFNDFHSLEISLTSYPKTARVNENYSFSISVSDYRAKQQYVASIYLNGEKQYFLDLKKGINQLQINFTKQGLQKVKIEIYNPENEYNGYGYKTKPFTLSFVTKVK